MEGAGPKGQVTKWVGLASGIWVQAFGGSATVFANYAPALKAGLQINQVQLNNLGVAKDFGDNVGMLPGILCNILPPWGILTIGVMSGFIGYGTMWLVLTQRIAPLPYWLLCVFLCLAANTSTWFNTAVLVTSMRNFPKSRGTVVGIIKGFIGLSGAVFTTIYVSLLQGDPESLLLFLALGPSAVCLCVMYFIRPVVTPDGTSSVPEYHDPKEHGGFVFLHVVCVALALFLFVASLAGIIFPVTPLISRSFVLVMVIFLAAPLLVPLKFLFDKRSWKRHNRGLLKPSGNDESGKLQEPLLKPDERNVAPPSPRAGIKDRERTASKQPKISEALAKSSGSPQNSSLISNSGLPHSQSPVSPKDHYKNDNAPILCMAQNNSEMDDDVDDGTLLLVGEGAVRRKKGPRRGEDFTLFEALVKADFWLLFFTFFCGVGTGVTATNNLGQIGLAQGYSDVTVFVSLVSVWNFLGRLGAGSLSEHYVRSAALPRTVWFLVGQVIMIVAHLLLASAYPGTLYVASMLVGLSWGIHTAIMVPTASELFGLRNFGSIYNFLAIGNPIGALLFSGVIAGYLYDKEATKKHANYDVESHILARLMNESEVSECVGAHCYRLTFLIMAGVCVLGLLMNLILTMRIKRVYRSLYANSASNSSAALNEECEDVGSASHGRSSH